MAEITVNPHRSSLRMNANIAALLMYIAAVVVSWIPIVRYVAWAVPLVFFFIEKQSSFVRFHAMQAFILNLVGLILSVIFTTVIKGLIAAFIVSPLVGHIGVLFTALLSGVIGLIAAAIAITIIVFSIIAMVKAYGYKIYKIPLIGGWAEKLMIKIGGNPNM